MEDIKEMIHKVRYDPVNWTWRLFERVFQELEKLKSRKGLNKEMVQQIVTDLCDKALKMARDNEERINALSSDVRMLKAGVDTLKNLTDKIVEQLNTVQHSVESMRNRITRLERNVSGISTRVGRLEEYTASTTIEARLSSCEKDIRDIRSTLLEATKTITTLTDRVKSLERSITQLRRQIKAILELLSKSAEEGA